MRSSSSRPLLSISKNLSTSDEKAKRLPEFPFSCFIVIKKVNSLLSFKILNDSFNIVSVTARYRLESCRYMADVRLCCPVIFVYPVRLLRFEIRSRTSLLEYTQPHAVRTMYRVAMYRIKYPLPNGPMPVPIGKYGRNPLQKTCLRSLYPKCEASV